MESRFLDGGLVGVPALILAFHKSVVGEEAFANISLLLLGKHPLGECLSLLSKVEFLCVLCLLVSHVLGELCVLLLCEAFGNVLSLVLYVLNNYWTIVLIY